jgi:undecaprenyl-diphosphatase
VDAGARAFVQSIASPGLTQAMRDFTFVGEWPVLTVLTVLGVVFFLLARRKHAALLLGITMAGAGLIEEFVKPLFHRTRPTPFFGLHRPSTYSFPSGHTLASCCLFGMLAVMLTMGEKRRVVRIAIWVGAVAMAGAIGFSRVYLGVHYATDVMGGYGIAVIWMSVVMWVGRRYTRRL